MKLVPRTSSRLARLGGAAALAVSLTLVAPAAAAGTPVNDDWESATEVTALPFVDAVDTSRATEDDVTPAGLGRYHFHTVWYHLDDASDGQLLVSAQGTRYTHGLAIYQADSATQSPDEWTIVDRSGGSRRNPGGFVVPVEADTDYFVGIGSYRSGGGSTRITIKQPAAYDVTLSDHGTYDPVDGSALVHGPMSADEGVTVYVSLELRQLVGDRVVKAKDTSRFTPGSDPSTWEMSLSGAFGFKVGDARLVSSRVQVFELGVRVDEFSFDEDTITLE
jgi:hypothetical protein